MTKDSCQNNSPQSHDILIHHTIDKMSFNAADQFYYLSSIITVNASARRMKQVGKIDFQKPVLIKTMRFQRPYKTVLNLENFLKL
jgi:hypothetical protein